ncbi:MAG TPA: YncE family protein [Actinomycetota bacterium]|nr:YncE family protein [Actinomycetota bacterium]
MLLVVLATVGLSCTGPGGPAAAGKEEPGSPRTSPTPSAAPPPSGVGSTPGGPATDRVWVALEDAGRTVLVDVGTERIVERFRTPGGPHNITVAGDGTVAVALWGWDRIALIRRDRVRFVVLGGAPHDVKVAGRTVVVANQGDARVDRVRLGGRRLRSVGLRADPHDLAVAPGGRRAWVTLEGTDDMAVVDVDRGRLLRYVSTGARPHDLLFAPDGRLWVTDWEGALHVFDGARLVRTLPLGVEAHHLAFTPGGEEAWITDHGAHRVYVLSVRPVRVLRSLRFPGQPHHVAITSDGRWAVVADHAGGRLLVYDADRRRRVGSIRVGAGPHGVWAAPAP